MKIRSRCVQEWNPLFHFSIQSCRNLVRSCISESERRYDKFTDETPLFIGQKINGRLSHTRRNTIECIVHEAARKAGLEQWKDVYPHCLRKTFQNVLKSEFSDRHGRLDEKDQEFLMGHILSGSLDSYYDKSKVEALRSEYARLPFGKRETLSKVDEEKQKLALNMRLLFVAGYSRKD